MSFTEGTGPIELDVHAQHVLVEDACRLQIMREDADMRDLLDLDHLLAP
jgi:hypothetical protein